MKKNFAAVLAAMLLFCSFAALAAEDPLIVALRGRQERREGVGKVVKTTMRAVIGAGIGGAAGYFGARLAHTTVPMAKGITAGAAAAGGLGGLYWDKKANDHDEAQSDREMVVIRDRADKVQGDGQKRETIDSLIAEIKAEQSALQAEQVELRAIEAQRLAVTVDIQTTLANIRAERERVPTIGVATSQSFVENCLKPKYAVTRGRMSLSGQAFVVSPGATTPPILGREGDVPVDLETWGRVDNTGQNFDWIPLGSEKVHQVGPGKFQIK